MAVPLNLPERGRVMTGPGGPGNNPEQLFAAGYAACFIGAMKAVAPAQKLRVPSDTAVTATVGLTLA